MKPRKFGINEGYLTRESALTEELRQIFGLSVADTGFIPHRVANCEAMEKLEAQNIEAVITESVYAPDWASSRQITKQGRTAGVAPYPPCYPGT